MLATARMLWRRAHTLAAAAMDAACMPARDGLVVMEDEAPDAYALPGLPGRVVISTGMLHTLDEAEHDILLAHERAHLAAHHYAFVALAQLGAAANPLLRPLATAVTYSIERWADENAAASTGDRKRVARAVGKAALAAHRAPALARAAVPPSASSAVAVRSPPQARCPVVSPRSSPRRSGAIRSSPQRPRPS
ncbi:M56 family metallopeptidase [Streptomyces sp. NPDC051917]|uniref:M56 family metallopeptidase n=1 Tax=Streptomyces sp. NPDC051917 TaxID=3154754 RepID=UPI00344F051D